MTDTELPTINLSSGAGWVEFIVLAEVTDADYSWSSDAVLKRQSDGALFFVQDSGCSRNSFGDYLTIADLKPLYRPQDALYLVSADDRPRMKKALESGEVVYR